MTDTELIVWFRDLAVERDPKSLNLTAARIKELTKREEELWNLLEEIDAQIYLAEEISPDFARKVNTALWES